MSKPNGAAAMPAGARGVPMQIQIGTDVETPFNQALTIIMFQCLPRHFREAALAPFIAKIMEHIDNNHRQQAAAVGADLQARSLVGQCAANSRDLLKKLCELALGDPASVFADQEQPPPSAEQPIEQLRKIIVE